MLESRHLRYFLAVAEELHFGRAAQRLHMAQPPLSQQIRKLEDELGVRLFERSSRSVSLTEEGKVLLGRAQRILGDLEKAEELVRAMARGEAGRIRLGFVGPAMETELASAIGSFRQQHQRVRLALEEATTSEQLERLDSGTLDIGHVRLFKHDTSGFAVRLISREEYILALPPGHKLEQNRAVQLADLDGQALVAFPRAQQPKLHDALFKALEGAGAHVEVTQEARRKETTLALVAARSGVALVPASARRSGRTDVVFREIEDETLPAVEIFQVWRPNQETAVLQKLLKHTEGLIQR